MFKVFKAKSRKRGYFGASGFGKTTMAIIDVLDHRHEYDCVFVFDDDAQFADRFPAFLCQTEAECVGAAASGFVCYNGDEMFDSVEEAFKWFCDFVFRYSCLTTIARPKKKILMVFDELQVYLNPHPSAWLSHPFAKCCGKGRWRGIEIFCICPSLSGLNPNFRGQITELVAFQHEDERNAEHVIAKGIPFTTLQGLREGEYVFWKKGEKGFQRGKVKMGSV